jgi:hypothetical protein
MALAIPLAMALGGCFISEEPLIGAEEAVFPFETLTFKEGDATKPFNLVRDGDAYINPEDKARLKVLFKDFGDGLYLAQISGEENGKRGSFYAVLRVDFDRKTAESYKAIGWYESARNGLRRCDDAALCIDDLDVYLELARGAISAGEKPDVTWTILTME